MVLEIPHFRKAPYGDMIISPNLIQPTLRGMCTEHCSKRYQKCPENLQEIMVCPIRCPHVIRCGGLLQRLLCTNPINKMTIDPNQMIRQYNKGDRPFCTRNGRGMCSRCTKNPSVPQNFSTKIWILTEIPIVNMHPRGSVPWSGFFRLQLVNLSMIQAPACTGWYPPRGQAGEGMKYTTCIHGSVDNKGQSAGNRGCSVCSCGFITNHRGFLQTDPSSTISGLQFTSFSTHPKNVKLSLESSSFQGWKSHVPMWLVPLWQ